MKSGQKYIYEFKVEKDLLDAYGHVNNAKYLNLYEDARWDILKKNAINRKDIKEKKIGPVILEVNVRFSRELLPGQVIKIETTSRKKNDLVLYFEQVMINEEGKIASKALFTAALFDLKKRKMIKPDEKWLKAFGF